MSCYQPLHLPTNTLHFNVQRFINTLPCGKCEGCQTARILDYKKRIYYEYKKCKDAGGFTFLTTLTYSEKYLPRVKWNGKHIPTFLKRDIQSFIKHFRTEFEKIFPSSSWLSAEPFRYFQVCEYGDEKGRPHYHILFHFYIPYDEVLTYRYIKGLLKLTWYRRIHLKNPILKVRTYFKNGKKKKYKTYLKTLRPSLGKTDISISKYTNSPVVAHDSALSYVADYLHKDFNFQDTHNQAIDSLSEDDKRNFLRLNGPFHLNSLSYGDISSSLSETDIKTGTIITSLDGRLSRQPMSKYLQRKIYYSLHTDKTYHLNENGIEFKASQMDSLRQNTRQNVALALGSVDNGLDSSTCIQSDGKFSEYITDAIEYINKIICYYGLDFVCNYNILFRNRYISPHLQKVLSNDYITPINVCFSNEESTDYYKQILTFDSQYSQHSQIFDAYPFDQIRVDNHHLDLLKLKYARFSLPDIDRFFDYLDYILVCINVYEQKIKLDSYYYNHNVKPLIKKLYGQT